MLSEDDIIVRYDGAPEIIDDCDSGYDPEEETDQFVEEELRIAETMSMEVLLNLNITRTEESRRQQVRRRNSNLKEINQLETLDEASRGKIKYIALVMLVWLHLLFRLSGSPIFHHDLHVQK